MVINLYSLAQNKAHPYKRHVQMIGCCTTGTSNIQVCISLADCILLISSPDHEVLIVSYCDQSLSVVRALSTFCFKRLLLQNG